MFPPGNEINNFFVSLLNLCLDVLKHGIVCKLIRTMFWHNGIMYDKSSMILSNSVKCQEYDLSLYEF